MKRVLHFLSELFHPPKWVTVLVPPVIFAALLYVFAAGQEQSVLAYPVFVLSAYCLTILLLPLPGKLRSARTWIERQIDQTAFGKAYVRDPAFRGSVGIYQGMTVNFLYVVFRVIVGVRYASVWFLSMAAYYLVLGGLRLSLVLSNRHRNLRREWDCYRRTAWLLFLLNIPMGGMIVLMVLTDSGYTYPGYVIYLSAMYTFYTMGMAIKNLIQYHKLGSPILSAAKVLNFIAALMSVLGLQTAMIAQFSTESDGFRRGMNAMTGGVIWLSVLGIAVYMLHQSSAGKGRRKPDEQIRK